MKVFRQGDTYIAPKGAFFDGNVKLDGHFIAPPDTHVWGKLVIGGRLELGPRSSVGGEVLAQSAIIGHGARIKGPLIVLENATVCDDATIHSIQAGGNVVIRPGVKVGDVTCDETITVYGKIKSGKLVGRNVKIMST
ncbi:MAG: polymer-forming cytoskeletal protein [Methanomicrobiales archaeon]|nr:polymer-forming cytoskeletal protein [Methanomicrobiales archaeon]